MAVKIRLQRHGKKKQPFYRIVVQDSRVARNGKVIEIVGLYNPLTNPAVVSLKEDNIKAWMAKGAKPTETVEKLLISNGLLTRKEPKPAAKKKAEPEKKAVKTTKVEAKAVQAEVAPEPTETKTESSQEQPQVTTEE